MSLIINIAYSNAPCSITNRIIHVFKTPVKTTTTLMSQDIAIKLCVNKDTYPASMDFSACRTVQITHIDSPQGQSAFQLNAHHQSTN